MPETRPDPWRDRFPRWVLRLWVVHLALVVTLSLAPPSALPLPPIMADKVLHFAAYSFLGFGALAGYRSRRSGLVAAAAMVALGGLLELVQSFAPGRSPELGDIAANTLGVLAGAAGGTGVRRALGAPGRPE